MLNAAANILNISLQQNESQVFEYWAMSSLATDTGENRRTVTKYIYLSIVLKYTLSICTLLEYYFFYIIYYYIWKTNIVLFTPLHFYQGPRSIKSILCSSFESQWVIFFFFFSKMWLSFFPDSLSVITLVGLYEVISQHFCEHWPVANVILLNCCK